MTTEKKVSFRLECHHQLDRLRAWNRRSRRCCSNVRGRGAELSRRGASMAGLGVHVWRDILESSRDVYGKHSLLKYNWIEKTITATAITLGYFAGDVPPKLMLLVIFTNWLWIPFILWGDLTIGKSLRTSGTPQSLIN